MLTAEYKKCISLKLHSYSFHLKSQAKFERRDETLELEDHILNILNLISEKKFTNANRYVKKMPCIDLIDETGDIAFQITISTTKDKLYSCIDKYFTSSVNWNGEKKYLYEIVKKSLFIFSFNPLQIIDFKESDIKKHISTHYKDHISGIKHEFFTIFSIDDFLNVIENQNLNKLEQILNYLNESLNYSLPNDINSLKKTDKKIIKKCLKLLKNKDVIYLIKEHDFTTKYESNRTSTLFQTSYFLQDNIPTIQNAVLKNDLHRFHQNYDNFLFHLTTYGGPVGNNSNLSAIDLEKNQIELNSIATTLSSLLSNLELKLENL